MGAGGVGMLRVISDYSLWELIEDSRQYKMILYADTKYRKQLVKLLNFIDVELACQISDDEEDDDCCQLYDLIYEDMDKIMVIVAKEDFSGAQKALTETGLQMGVNFKNIERYSQESNLLPYYYDPVIGYNLGTKDKETAGFCIYGDLEKAKLHIMTLGGSTTDASIYAFKCWSECLHDILEERGLSNVVMCGGVAGYASSEELFKLIRDGFSLKPDIVLNYSGVNDMQVEEEYPYINFYMRQICQFLANKSAMNNLNFDSHSFGISYGINGFDSRELKEKCDFWMQNQKMVHALCQMRNIKHITFFQPTLFNGAKQLSNREQSYQLNLVYVGVKRECRASYINKTRDFTRIIRRFIQKYEWIYDLTEIFGAEDIYMDFAHVNERGSRIIAGHVADALESREWI